MNFASKHTFLFTAVLLLGNGLTINKNYIVIQKLISKKCKFYLLKCKTRYHLYYVVITNYNS